MAGAVRCVAEWAVEPCTALRRTWKESAASSATAIWTVQNGLGTFFGSQTGGRTGLRELTLAPASAVQEESGGRSKRKARKKKR
jgi:hypothetical protein